MNTHFLKYSPIAALIFLLVGVGCTKTTHITNNIDVREISAFSVEGISDISISPANVYLNVPYSVTYRDSAQQRVTLSLSGLPAGITMEDNWIKSGYPTFSSYFRFYDTNIISPALPGIYPVTLIASGEITGIKTYAFNFTVVDVDRCSAAITGGYSGCVHLTNRTNYNDEITADTLTTNKIWFRNFAGTGKTVCAMYYCVDKTLKIPRQNVGGVVFEGHGIKVSTFLIPHKLNIFATVNDSAIALQM